MIDPYENTIYRDLVNAHEAIDLAHFLNGDLPPNRIVALAEIIQHIDIAASALRDARIRAVEEHRTLNDALLDEAGFPTVSTIRRSHQSQ